MIIRPATESDLPALRPVFEAAKEIMRADGNFEQWSSPGFPGEDLLLSDLARAGGYVISSNPHIVSSDLPVIPDDRCVVPNDPSVISGDPHIVSSDLPVIPSVAKESILAYFALLPSPEPTYARIEGAWLTDEPYGVIHRMASYPDVHGVFDAVIDFASAHYPHLRIDTHRDNRIMRHLIEKHGFTYCGIIWLEDGTERLAYER